MTSGITRYTKGTYNATAIADVYNKAKEIYINDVVPNPSGIELVTLDQLYDDTHLAHDMRPILSPYGHTQQQGPVTFAMFGTEVLLTPWSEVEEGSTYGLTDSTVGCSSVWDPSVSASNSTNTVVEKGHSYLYARTNGVWALVKKSDALWKGQYQPAFTTTRPYTYNPNVGCGEPWRAELGLGCIFEQSPDGFDTMMPGWWLNGDGSILRNPGAYQHPYDSPTGRWSVTPGTDMAVHIAYYRLILRDPDGVDDRHLSNFITHHSMDAYLPPDTYDGDRGIGRYKRVTNDWVANSLTTQVSGLSRAEFLAIYADLEAILPTTP